MSDPLSVDAVFRGLDTASEAIKREVGALIPAAAETMAHRLIARYPIGTKSHPDRPHMREDVRIRTRQSQQALLPIRQVVGPRLAFIWQNGTKRRVDATRHNANRGRSPAHDPGFFERTAVQTRTEMLSQAQAILDRSRVI